jgi:hypothetical protein
MVRPLPDSFVLRDAPEIKTALDDIPARPAPANQTRFH